MTTQNLLGQQVGSYQIEAIIGQGTTATVYRALTPDRNAVVLKVFSPTLNEQATLLARFQREGELVAQLDHPHIVPILEAGQTEGLTYLTMPLIEGQTLEDRLRHTPRLDEVTATEIGWQIADALYCAHSHHIIHRDVKPSNILLTTDGHAHLTDFGIAHALDCPNLTQSGHLLGTPTYLSPEQALHRNDVDHRADLYSLGVVLYHIATGQLPFQGSTLELLHAHVYEVPPLPSAIADISTDLEAVIWQALEKQPDKRFADGRLMARELLRLNDRAKQRSPAWSKIRRQRRRLKSWLSQRYPRLAALSVNNKLW